LVISSQGDVLKSAGDLQNDEAVARTFARILTVLSSHDATLLSEQQGKAHPGVERVSLHYRDHSYIATHVHGQISIVKVTREESTNFQEE
jgi:hypothetical protein